ncbi:hypothetical protein AO268_19310 [Pseudomonas sp. ICMP 8385]|nr:hypothetical protein AO268_19310 [Pseudomonas sp. ICMP 8385]
MPRRHVTTRRRVITSRRPVTIKPDQGRATVHIPARGGVIIEVTVVTVEAMAVAVIMAGGVAGTGNQLFLETARNAPFFLGERLSALSYFTAILKALLGLY